MSNVIDFNNYAGKIGDKKNDMKDYLPATELRKLNNRQAKLREWSCTEMFGNMSSKTVEAESGAFLTNFFKDAVEKEMKIERNIKDADKFLDLIGLSIDGMHTIETSGLSFEDQMNGLLDRMDALGLNRDDIEIINMEDDNNDN